MFKWRWWRSRWLLAGQKKTWQADGFCSEDDIHKFKLKLLEGSNDLKILLIIDVTWSRWLLARQTKNLAKPMALEWRSFLKTEAKNYGKVNKGL